MVVLIIVEKSHLWRFGDYRITLGMSTPKVFSSTLSVSLCWFSVFACSSFAMATDKKVDPTSCKVVLAGTVAKNLLTEVSEGLLKLGRSPLLVGFLANTDPAARKYAEWTDRTCREKWDYMFVPPLLRSLAGSLCYLLTIDDSAVSNLNFEKSTGKTSKPTF